MIKKNSWTISLFLMVLSVISCQKEIYDNTPPVVTGTVQLQMKAVMNGTPLQLNTSYKNIFDESFTPTSFKYYISKIQLINTDSGKTVDATGADYFLVNAGDTTSFNIKETTEATTYNQVSFVIGVDSIRNVSGAQTGALDPANGMFWTWNSGYIMAKLEGVSPVSNQTNNKFEYHIGGFSGVDNVVQRVTLSLPQNLIISANKTSTLTITADIAAWFSNPNDIPISVIPVCTTPGPLAKKIADNYAKMFTVVLVEN